MPARRARHMMRDAVFVHRAVDRMVMLSVVRPRLRVGLGKGDQASAYDKGSDEFFLHHHSWDRPK